MVRSTSAVISSDRSIESNEKINSSSINLNVK